MMENLIDCLRRKQLPSFLHDGDNIVDRVNPHDLQQYIGTLENLLHRVKILRSQKGMIEYASLAVIFNANGGINRRKLVRRMKSKL